MIFSDLPSPAEASSHTKSLAKDFAQAGNPLPLFGIVRSQMALDMTVGVRASS